MYVLMYVYKYNLVKARRIRWCTCRVENILTLGKLLSLCFCFLLHSILFLISQTSYRTYKIILSYELAPPTMGTIFLVYNVIARAGVIFGIISRVVGIAAVKSHEAKPSAISPLYRKRVELSQNFTTAHAITY